MKRSHRSKLLSLVGAAVLGLGLAAPAVAQDQTSITIVGGSLTIDNPAAAEFPQASITGADQTIASGLDPFLVSDLRGLGLGWHVSVQATQFSTGGADPKTLANGSLAMSAPTVSQVGTISLPPTIETGPYTIDTASPVVIARAGLGIGMGKFQFTATDLSLELPADVYAGAYTSTVTLTVATGVGL